MNPSGETKKRRYKYMSGQNSTEQTFKEMSAALGSTVSERTLYLIDIYTHILPLMRIVGYPMPMPSRVLTVLTENDLEALISVVCGEIVKFVQANDLDLDTFSISTRILTADIVAASASLPSEYFMDMVDEMTTPMEGAGTKYYDRYLHASLITSTNQKGGVLSEDNRARLREAGKNLDALAEILYNKKFENVTEYLDERYEKKPRTKKELVRLIVAKRKAAEAAGQLAVRSGAAGQGQLAVSNADIGRRLAITSQAVTQLGESLLPGYKGSALADNLSILEPEIAAAVILYSHKETVTPVAIVGRVVQFRLQNGLVRQVPMNVLVASTVSQMQGLSEITERGLQTVNKLRSIKAGQQFYRALQKELMDNKGRNFKARFATFFEQFTPDVPNIKALEQVEKSLEKDVKAALNKLEEMNKFFPAGVSPRALVNLPVALLHLPGYALSKLKGEELKEGLNDEELKIKQKIASIKARIGTFDAILALGTCIPALLWYSDRIDETTGYKSYLGFKRPPPTVTAAQAAAAAENQNEFVLNATHKISCGAGFHQALNATPNYGTHLVPVNITAPSAAPSAAPEEPRGWSGFLSKFSMVPPEYRQPPSAPSAHPLQYQ